MKTKSILVVDDDQRILRLIMRILSQSYDVVCVESAKGALEVAAQPGPIDLLLCDVWLPYEIPGPELAAEIKQIHPQMRVILMSGETGRMLADGWKFLGKPFRNAELLELVRLELSRPSVQTAQG